MDFDQKSAIQDNDAVHAPRQLEIVRGDQGRNPFAPKQPNQLVKKRVPMSSGRDYPSVRRPK